MSQHGRPASNVRAIDRPRIVHRFGTEVRNVGVKIIALSPRMVVIASHRGSFFQFISPYISTLFVFGCYDEFEPSSIWTFACLCRRPFVPPSICAVVNLDLCLFVPSSICAAVYLCRRQFTIWTFACLCRRPFLPSSSFKAIKPKHAKQFRHCFETKPDNKQRENRARIRLYTCSSFRIILQETQCAV